VYSVVFRIPLSK
jgi:hypothetical protein